MLSNKATIICILMFMFVSCGPTKKASNMEEVSLVKPKYEEINEILSSIHNEIKNLFKDGKTVFVIKTEDINGSKKFNVSIYKNSDFRWKLRETKEVPYGFFMYNNLHVIVFGQNAKDFFDKEEDYVFFEWLQPLPKLPDDKVIIPVNFEPPVWKYEFVNMKFIYKEVGY